MTNPPPIPDGLLAEIAALPPGDALARLRGLAHPLDALLTAADDAERLVISDLARALTATRALVTVADGFGAVVPRARARRALAQALAYSNRFDEALGWLEEGAGLADAGGERVEGARARLAMLHALARQGRYDRAVAVGEEARRAFVAAGALVLAARADINLGVTQRMRGNPRGALEHFDRAAPALDQEPLLLAQLESNRAEALLDLTQFERAERAFESALGAFRRAGIARAAAIVEGNLADLSGRQGRIERALTHFERARRQLGDQDAPGDVARLQAEQAEVMGAVGLYEQAADALRGAIPVLQAHRLTWEEARALSALGRVLIRSGEFPLAKESLDRGESVFGALAHPAGIARVRMAQAEIAIAEGDWARGEELLASAAGLIGDRPADAAQVRLYLAQVALRTGRLDLAGEEIELGIATARSLELAPLLADLLHLRARVHRAAGRPAEALADLRAAIAQVERVRGTLQADRFRAAFLGDRAATYEECVSTALDLGQPDAVSEAFAVIERAKGRSLLDLLRGGVQLAESVHAPARDDAEAGLLSALAGLRGELNALYAQLDDTVLRPRTGGPLKEWKGAVSQRERAIAGIESRLAATKTLAGVFAEPVGLEEARRAVGPGTVAVEYFVEEGNLSAVVFSGDILVVRRRFARMEEVAERINAFHFQIGRAIARGLPGGAAGDRLADDACHELGGLWQLLLAPIKDAVGNPARLLVIPHGPLFRVPFHALWHDGRALIEDCEVVYAPSAGILAHLPLRTTGGRTLVVGVSDALAPQAESEAAEIAALGASELLVGPDATIARVLRSAEHAGLVHLATHARFVAGDPLASGVRLADGWLSAREIFRIRLNGAAVLLSGCDTGRSAVASGDELLGLVRAFFGAGASSLVLSLWPVHDESGARSMETFYKDWYSRPGSGSGGLSRALRTAQIASKKQHPHPAAWAPFILMGSP